MEAILHLRESAREGYDLNHTQSVIAAFHRQPDKTSPHLPQLSSHPLTALRLRVPRAPQAHFHTKTGGPVRANLANLPPDKFPSRPKQSPDADADDVENPTAAVVPPHMRGLPAIPEDDASPIERASLSV